MKCLLLAGGKGDRLWPLSRQNYPKQFITIQNNHSIFQETIARNMAFCDEFIIVTNKEYQNIVENQMKVFQGVTYRCVYEEIGRKTSAAIILSALQLPLSELLFVVTADHLIGKEGYKENILQGKELALKGNLVTFGMDIEKPDTRFGYICYEGEDVKAFCEKPNTEQAKEYFEAGNYYLNSGMFLFRVGDFLNEVKTLSPYMLSACEASLYMRKTEGNRVFYDKDVLMGIPASPIEKTVFEKTKICKVIHGSFAWKDIGSLEDVSNAQLGIEDENVISHACENVHVINTCEKHLIVTNQVKDLVIVNTKDALYVGKEDASVALKEIIANNPEKKDYFTKSNLFYRKWGNYEIIQKSVAAHFEVRKVTILPGKTIYLHKHEQRNENWAIVCGQAKAFIDGKEVMLGINDFISVPANTTHQISNIGTEKLVFIETATGIMQESEDIVSIKSKDLSEASLGYEMDSMVKLRPAFKDYLWGGTRLRDEFGKQCDYDIVAESWELSAHPDGQSVVDSGKYKGQLFGSYLKKIGIENLGWKFQTFHEFPLLVKFIDAKEDLSIQVHPDDEYALEHENSYGKHEMWLVLDAKPDAYLYCGFAKDVTRDEVKAHIENDTLLSILNKVPIKKGDVIYIPAGMVHAIGKGTLICEIQQNSNITYRVYDYNRKDRYGNTRQLDIEKALDVMLYKAYKPEDISVEEAKLADGGNIIGRSKYFSCGLYDCADNMEVLLSDESFCSFVILEGEAKFSCRNESLYLKKGDCIFVPKQEEAISVEGTCKFIKVKI